MTPSEINDHFQEVAREVDKKYVNNTTLAPKGGNFVWLRLGNDLVAVAAKSRKGAAFIKKRNDDIEKLLPGILRVEKTKYFWSLLDEVYETSPAYRLLLARLRTNDTRELRARDIYLDIPQHKIASFVTMCSSVR